MLLEFKNCMSMVGVLRVDQLYVIILMYNVIRKEILFYSCDHASKKEEGLGKGWSGCLGRQGLHFTARATRLWAQIIFVFSLLSSRSPNSHWPANTCRSSINLSAINSQHWPTVSAIGQQFRSSANIHGQHFQHSANPGHHSANSANICFNRRTLIKHSARTPPVYFI